MKKTNKKTVGCFAIIFAMCALQSQAYISLNFTEGGGSIGSTSVVTLSNLVGGVTVSCSTSGTPSLNSSSITADVTGTIGLNFLAVDDLSSPFDPATWTGGGQSAGNSIKADAPGWGVRRDGKINGAIQGSEAVLVTFDFSDLNIDASQMVELSKVVLAENLGGDVWIKRAGASTGTRLLENGLIYSDTIEISDGDQLAFMRNTKDVYLNTLEFDVVERPEAPTKPVVTDFKVSGGNTGAASIDLIWSNLTGTVTVTSSDTVAPSIDANQNSFTTNAGVSGIIKVNVQAVDSATNTVPFVPSTWSGGTQSAGCAIDSNASEGWGVRWDEQIAGRLQDTEALILTFDLSGLSLAADQSLKLTGITFNDQGDGTANGDVWMRDPDLPAGVPGAGVAMANDVITFTNAIEIVDGDQFALMRGAKDTRLEKLEMDIVSDSGKILGLSIAAGAAGHVALSTTNLTEDSSATLQASTSLTSPFWTNVASSASVSETEWEVPTSADSAFFRAQRQRKIDNPRYGYRFYPVADTFVSEEFPDANYGDREDMKVTALAAPAGRVAYLKFVVDEVPDSIDEVWLKVNAGAAISGISVRAVDDNSWDEDSITWNTAPARGTLQKYKATVNGGWNTFDLSSYVTNAGTYSIALVSGDSVNKTIWAKESVFNPVLEIVPTPDEPDKYVGVFGGGPLYGGLSGNLEEMKASGFDTLLLWAGKVQTDGSINYNLSENKIIQNGQYIGDPDWPDELAALKTGTTSVTRVEMSLSAWGDESFQKIDDLIAAEGIGEDSSLYQTFKVMRDVLGVDAINYDDESHYDVASSVQFGIMLSTLGYKVTLCPYRNSDYWQAVYDQLNAYQPGLCDRVYLQCYAGGAGNTPSGWNGYFSGIQVSGSVSAGEGYASPSTVQSTFSGWSSTSDGGFLWLLDDILKDESNTVEDYATAVINGLN